jgi:hypothetical protein
VTTLKNRIKGKKFVIVHCKGALESFDSAMESLPKKKREALKRGMILQIQRLADGHQMSKENFPREGKLPNKTGQHGNKHFHALKRIPVRGYCWLSQTQPDTYFISHYIYKDQSKLNGSDTIKVGSNWQRIEEHGYEF